MFGKQEVEFLGFLVNKGGIKPGMRKVDAIRHYEIPKSVHDVRRFLGLTSFFRRFIPNYAVLAKPLSDLTRQHETYRWENEQEMAFDNLRRLLTSNPVLKLYNPDDHTELHTDASSLGVAGMLMQKDATGKLRLVYCVSKKATESEAMFHSSKMELLAIVWSVQRLRTMLLPITFTIVTDCQALTYASSKNATPQIARWMVILSEYTYKIIHRKGDKMKHIDALSRAPQQEAKDTETEVEERLGIYTCISEEEYIEMIQASDPRLREIISILKRDMEERTTEELHKIKTYEIEDGRLLKKVVVQGRERRLYVIPNSMRKSTVVKFHNQMGHFGVDVTVARILNHYWFPKLKRYVRRHISSCIECLYTKIPAGKRPGFLNPIPVPKRPFSRIHVDHTGPYVTSNEGNTYLLGIIDGLTKYVRLYPVDTTTAERTIQKLEEYFLDYGLPDIMVTDRGSCFTANSFRKFVEENGIQHNLISSRHPQANGQIERIHRTLLPVITMTFDTEEDWDIKIKEVERDLNTARSKTTRRTPFEALYGFIPRFYDGILRKVARVGEEEWIPPQRIQEEIKENIQREQAKMKSRFDKKRYQGIRYEIGDVVVMIRAPVATGESTKTQLKYKGPLVISKILPHDTYQVMTLNKDKGGHTFTTNAHVSQLKIYRNCYETESEESEDDENIIYEESGNNEGRDEAEREKSPDITKEKDQAYKETKRTRKLPEKLKDFDLSG